MTKPESLPVEEARKKFADILDGTQFRSAHTEITRRGKAAGVIVPPEWYEQAVEALTGKRRKASPSPPVAAAPRAQVTQAVADRVETVTDSVISSPVAAMSDERVKELAEAAEARHPEWIEEIRQAHPAADELRLHYLIVEAGVRMGFRPRELDAVDRQDEPDSTDGEEQPS